MVFTPSSPRTHNGFIEHVSKDIIGNEKTPSDFEGTLWYVLYQLPERNRDVFLKIERDCDSVRTIGMEYGVSGQRISELNKTTKERMINLWGKLLKTGFMEQIQSTAKEFSEYGEQSAKEKYYKLGYTDGYEDGSKNKLAQCFATEEYNNISLSDLSLSYRVQHYLFDEGLLNISQIIERGDGLLSVQHLGRESYTELIDRLTEYGVNVKKHFPKMIKKYRITVEEENV